MIKDYWNEKARLEKLDERCTMVDVYLKRLEVERLSTYLVADDILLEVGCGNGHATLRFAEKVQRELIGVDFAEEMISCCEIRVNQASPSLKAQVQFVLHNILQPFPYKDYFSKVISARCLQNLGSWENQKLALKNIHDALKPGGQALLSENTVQGFNKLNELRRAVGLHDLPIRWHNLYIDEDQLIEFIQPYFILADIDNFSSTYYIASRVFNAKLAYEKDEEPDYMADINLVGTALPPIGDYGLLKILVLQKC
jgi:SAM-dependent methyltransferase